MLNPRTSRVWWARSGSNCTTDKAIGSIISDVAVLLTHMLTSAEPSRNPAMIDEGFVPSMPISPMATRYTSPTANSASTAQDGVSSISLSRAVYRAIPAACQS